jgi:glycosyltransferase involved in cell wall biosynthesis
MKIYFDCTDTFRCGLNTGIQRVVRNIIAREKIYREEYGIETAPVIAHLGKYFLIKPEYVLQSHTVTGSIGTKIKSALDRARSKFLSLWTEDSLPYNFSAMAFSVVEKLLKQLFWVIKELRVIGTLMASGFIKVNFRPVDKLVLLDAFWTYDFSRSVKGSHLKTSQVISVIYDLVPLNYSQYVEDITLHRFMRDIPKLVAEADHFMCISHSVNLDFEDYLKITHKGERRQVDFWTLGSDFSMRRVSEASDIREEVKSVFDMGPVWIEVGTIEPRKNHSYALDAFEVLWAHGEPDVLFIVGRIGWKCKDILNRVKTHPMLGKKLFFSWDISDDELAYSYNKSEGLIFASHVEGFGLPIIEAMTSGIKVLCSNIPVFREVGGDYPEYFDLKNPGSMAELVKKMRGQPAKSSKIWLSWDNSARQFMDKVVRVQKQKTLENQL